MPVEASISGHDGFNRLAAACNLAANDYDRLLDEGLENAGEVVAKEIRSSSKTYTPAGYEEVFAKSMVTKVSAVRRGLHRVASVVVRAFGRRGHDRQVEEIERGRLKHPFWGTWVHTPKAWQKVRPGLVSEPAQRAAPEATQEIDKACGKIADKINGRM